MLSFLSLFGMANRYPFCFVSTRVDSGGDEEEVEVFFVLFVRTMMIIAKVPH